ncbi:uncharacterized protein LOC141711486 isoform X1 [Apium graveolens]|uniref:uncharacterized protein LOC141711486 isoform X1 n=2 Tax=Apium graveolens TaxID=4045 RepID=UPI003D7A404F
MRCRRGGECYKISAPELLMDEDCQFGEFMAESKIAKVSEKNEGGGGVTVSNGTVNNSAGGSVGDAGGGAGGAADGVIPVDNEYYNYVLGRTIAALNYDSGISLNWPPEEDCLMQNLLVKYASESSVTKYAKVAQQLNDKRARDVSLRITWLKENKKENRKRRKDDDYFSRKIKEKKEKVNVVDASAKASSHLTNQSSGLLYAQTTVYTDSDVILYEATDGANAQLLKRNAQLLKQNAHAMDQISANFRAFKIHDNINLFCQARNNIKTVLNDQNQLEFMKRMPPFPEKLNEDLLNNLLPSASFCWKF